MSEHTKDNKALMATPESAMYSYLTDCRIPKNEYEHYAGRKILNLEAQLAESQRQNAELRDLCMEVYSDHKAPDMPMIGYNECEKDKCDWCARLDKTLAGKE